MAKWNPGERQLKRGEVQKLARENPREAWDANTLIVCLLMKLGGGATIEAFEFVEAEKLVDKIEVLPEQSKDKGTRVHFRVKL